MGKPGHAASLLALALGVAPKAASTTKGVRPGIEDSAMVQLDRQPYLHDLRMPTASYSGDFNNMWLPAAFGGEMQLPSGMVPWMQQPVLQPPAPQPCAGGAFQQQSFQQQWQQAPPGGASQPQQADAQQGFSMQRPSSEQQRSLLSPRVSAIEDTQAGMQPFGDVTGAPITGLSGAMSPTGAGYIYEKAPDQIGVWGSPPAVTKLNGKDPYVYSVRPAPVHDNVDAAPPVWNPADPLGGHPQLPDTVMGSNYGTAPGGFSRPLRTSTDLNANGMPDHFEHDFDQDGVFDNLDHDADGNGDVDHLEKQARNFPIRKLAVPLSASSKPIGITVGSTKKYRVQAGLKKDEKKEKPKASKGISKATKAAMKIVDKLGKKADKQKGEIVPAQPVPAVTHLVSSLSGARPQDPEPVADPLKSLGDALEPLEAIA